NAYAFGNIDLWARLASNAPGLVNLTTQLPFLRDIAKLVGGIPAQRRIPAFAPETFKEWFRRTSGWATETFASSWKRRASTPNHVRGAQTSAAPPVLLWADTFNNYFQPSTAKAAVEVLETAGFRRRGLKVV